jgi:DNA-directed RNA polymerase
MSRINRTLSGLLVDVGPSRTITADTIRVNFYREEFLKHQECLQRQRESYSECTITEMESALRRVMARVEELCARGDADVDSVVSRLLHTFDGVTKLSAWSDPTHIH